MVSSGQGSAAQKRGKKARKPRLSESRNNYSAAPLESWSVLEPLLEETQRSMGVIPQPFNHAAIAKLLSPRAAAFGLDARGYKKLCVRDALERLVLIDAILPQAQSALETAQRDDLVKRLIPTIAKRDARSPQIRIWCVRCGDHAFAWSIAAAMRAALSDAEAWAALILATDPSPLALERAQAHACKMPRALRSCVQFAWLDLEGKWPTFSGFDLIIAPTLSVFETRTREHLLARMAASLRADGCCYVASAEESLPEITKHFSKRLAKGIFARA